MKERVQRIDNQTYWYLMQLLDLEVDEAKKKFPRNTKIFNEVSKAATAVLEKHGYRVCGPHMSTSETGSTFARLLSADVKAAAVRINLWKRNTFFQY